MAEQLDWPWRQWSLLRPETDALVMDDGVLTWSQLTHEIALRAVALQQRGVKSTDILLLRGKNSVALLLNYLAALRCGIKVLPLNPQLPVSLLAQLLPELGGLFWGWSEESSSWPTGVNLLTDLARREPQAEPEGITSPLPNWAAQRPATLTLTSGSSGVPKAVLHTLGAHLANAQGVLSEIPFSAESCWLLSLPIYHISGQGIIWRWLHRGARLRVGQTGTALEELLRGCSHASLVPTQLRRLLASPSFVASHTVNTLLLGGAAIPLDLVAATEGHGIACWCGYAMTEMGSTITVKRADGDSGVGQLLTGRELKIVNEEIWLRGDGLAEGYWQKGAIVTCCDNDGWLHTRDRGKWIGDQLHLKGRCDNLFFSGGEAIQPEEIEKVLLTHPAIHQAVVVPIEDSEFGHRPVAVLDAEEMLDFDTLTEWLEGKIARYQRPIHYYRLPENLGAIGIKLSRHAVQQWVRTLCGAV